MKILYFSHGHPNFSKGGGELAAYYLWQEVDSRPEHTAWLVARGQPEILHKFTSLAAVGDHEFLLAGNASIRELNATAGLDAEGDLAQLLRRIRPDVVHFHHYILIGIELIRLVRNTCPDARIFLTLHEYIAICLNNGQMVKTDGRLCHRYSPRECHLCFPQITAEDIFLRERYIKSFFRLVDGFISPSHFLRDRYAAWGLDPARIAVLENGLPHSDRIAPRELRYAGETRARFAYFGQINPYKGVDVILEAFARLPEQYRESVTLDVFGTGLQQQTPEVQRRITELVEKCQGTARLCGPYEPEEMPRLVAGIDWIIMGSVWWENSPLVIQEAFKFGRPIICPDIGGMAEKVQPMKGGLNFRARDSVSLADVIQRIIDQPELFDELLKNMPGYPDIREVADRHLAHYAR